MSSNYPPGVTGNEPEIAGRPMRTMNVDCEQESLDMVPAHWAREVVKDLASPHPTRRDWEELADLLADSGWTVETECGFGGDVEVEVEGNTAYWECPRCGQDNEYELDDGPDPDEQRDRMMEERWAE